jgi:hypothetical protein
LVASLTDDAYEREADRVAALIAATPSSDISQAPPASPTGLAISRFVQGSAETDDDDASVVFDDEAETPTTAGASFATRLTQSVARGRSLPETTRRAMEGRFGLDFSRVRVHTDGEAHHLSDDIEAVAFTHGSDIYFAAGAFSPGTPTGDRLLAHELTHVVQQTGGGGGHLGAAAVQRQRFRGTAVHNEIESRLRKANSNLITEAPIPGGTAMSSYDFEKVGYADLYTSSHSGAVIGVRGEYETAPNVNPADDPTKQRRYRPIKPTGRKGRSTRGKRPTPKRGKGEVDYQPRPQGDTDPFTGEFPETFAVGDLKPTGPEKTGEGIAQLANYISGLRAFVKDAASDGKVTRGTIDGKLLSGLTIPPELDYRNFNQQNANPPSNIYGFNDRTGRRRYWLFELRDRGIFYYFDLAHPNPSAQGREQYERAFRSLTPLKEELTERDAGIHNAAGIPVVSRHLRSGARRRRMTRQRRVASPGTRSRPNALQRKGRTTPRPKQDWPARGKAWESKRDEWDRRDAKPFLGSREGKVLRERAEINEQLGITGETAPGSTGVPARNVESIELWSGRTGIILGKARFALGGVFDKISDVFDWIKTRFSGFHRRMMQEPTGLPTFGWQKTLIRLLIKAVRVGFREFLSVFYETCANCVSALLQKTVDQFKQEISNELGQRVESYQAKFEAYETQLRDEFTRRFSGYDDLIDTIKDAQRWLSIASALVNTIRAGVQVVSCLTPPALGCLWGLVVNIGIEAALDLVIGTEWFQKNIINHPSIRDLIKQFAGPTYRSLIAESLRAAGLTEYAKGITDCGIVEQIEPPALQTDLLSGEEFNQNRADWELKYRAQMIRDLRFRFHVRPGQPASEDDLYALVEAIRRSGLEPEALKKTFDSAPKWSNGKLDLHALRRSLGGRAAVARQLGAGRTGADLEITKRATEPRERRLEVGPRVFSPGGPPGDQEPSVLPGAGIRF